VSEVRVAGVRRKGRVHNGATDSVPAIETSRRERSVGVAPGSVLVLLRSWRTARRSSISRRQSVQSTRWRRRRSRSLLLRAPSTNADRNSASSAHGAFLTPTSQAPDVSTWRSCRWISRRPRPQPPNIAAVRRLVGDALARCAIEPDRGVSGCERFRS